ncbi:MAG: ADOP family duplicated permease [Gemmatimonadales bacterium]
MPWKQSPKLPRGIRRLFALPSTRASLLRDADDEIAFHFDMWKAEFRKLGMSDAEAEAEAQRRFGDTTEYRDYAARRATHKARSQRVVEWFAAWMQDVRFAARHLRKAPAFSAIVVLTLALGIGANTAVFSVVHHLLIAPLPYPNGNRIVAMRVMGHGAFTSGLATMSPDAPATPRHELLDAWAARAHSVEMIAGVQEQFLSILPNGEQDTVTHAFVTANFLTLLGAHPAAGRAFRADEEQDTTSRVAMISYGWWRRAYGGRDDIVGQLTEWNGVPYTIVGVMPPGLTIPMTPRALDWMSDPTPDVWLPDKLEGTGYPIGLLRPGVSAENASRELQGIANTTRIPGDTVTPRARAMRAQDFLAPREVRTIVILFVAVGVLLLIACANVANLLLVRAWTRRGEFAIRMGLGAGRARLVRLALTESTLLAGVAGAIGVLVAWQGVRVIAALRPVALDSLAEVHIEPAVLLWTAGISVATGLLFGGAAALFVGSRNVADLLRSETRTSSGTGGSRGVRSSLIVLEIALSLTLLVGAGLLTRSFAALQRTPLGFDPHDLVSIDVLVPRAIAQAGRGAAVRNAIVEHLRETPGVLDAAFGMLPTAGFRSPGDLAVEDASGAREVGVPQHTTTWITPSYFATSRITLVAGRTPIAGAADTVPTPSFNALSEEVVVNRALARRIAPDGNAIGVRIRNSSIIGPRSPVPAINAWSTIVGIADDVHLPGTHGDVQDYQVYTMPTARMPTQTFVVRMAGVPPNVESVLRAVIHGVEPTLVARRARVGDDYLREALAPTRFAMALLVAFAFVALVLSVVGLYGSIAYTVSQRTREIGIRIALGATPRAVMGLVLGDGVRLALTGLVIGLLAAAAATRALTSLLYSVSPGDPATFVVIGAGVAVVAIVASYIPARRAVRIDPVESLRAD